MQRALLSTYKRANRSGLLDTWLAERLFRRSYFAYKRLVEDPFAKLVKARPELFAGGDVLDVGANIGYTAQLFARAVQAPYRVHAFEPEERNFRWLTHTIERLGDRVVAHQAAVGAHEGEIELWNNAANHSDHRIATTHLRDAVTGPTQRVPITTIDAHVARSGAPVSFIKIDVQGFEPAVLDGMRETVARHPQLHVALELMPGALEELGFAVDAFVRDIGAMFPAIAILERDGGLHRATTDTLVTTARTNELGYVDLVCSARDL
ncbi:MAG: FkbM family methyltransferase [Kofleriaceae bacterium]|nr:FkbM family methyltransferase [Kofleriaceae bacterium]